MRAHGVVESAVGFDGTSDHMCWGYRSSEERRGAVTAWLAQGLIGGQRAWYVAERTEAELRAELADLPARDDHLASGALRLLPAAEVYGLDPQDPVEQLAVYAGASRQIRRVWELCALDTTMLAP